MSEEYPFDAAKLATLREEVRREGLLADKFLGHDPELPTFGLNLACAWPFPEAWRESYERMAHRLGALGPCVHSYPFASTHVTLVTFVDFGGHVRPTLEFVESFASKADEILETLAPLFAENSADRIKPFTLQPHAPVLSRSAVILPLQNPGGEVARLRQRVTESLRRNVPLHRELAERGFKTPGIIHSTVMRFVITPTDLDAFLLGFDEIAGDTEFPAIEVGELLLTSETKPYMRAGEILNRIKLKA